ncbi:hypothetical protein BLA29_013831, partial [Euroglyphus maynei]
PPPRPVRRYRVKGYDPNYEYIGPEPYPSESEHSDLIDFDEMEHPATAIAEQISHDGRKVKTYVLSGVYRKKVDEIIRNDHNNDDLYSSNHADESRQIVHFIRPDANHDEQKLHELLEKCDDDPNAS